MAEQQERIFRVLCLDGGGAKGFYTLGALKEIEALVGCRLCEKFDLIYGTSTGAIIAALLGLGKSVDEVEALYRKHVVTVMARWLPSQKTAALETLAAEVFGELKFDAFKTDMGIVGTRWKEERPIIFKTNRRQALLGKATFEPGFGCHDRGRGRRVLLGLSVLQEEVRDYEPRRENRGARRWLRCEQPNALCHSRRDRVARLFAHGDVRVVSIGVGEYPTPKLPAWSLRKWASKLPTMVFLQKTWRSARSRWTNCARCCSARSRPSASTPGTRSRTWQRTCSRST